MDVYLWGKINVIMMLSLTPLLTSCRILTKITYKGIALLYYELAIHDSYLPLGSVGDEEGVGGGGVGEVGTSELDGTVVVVGSGVLEVGVGISGGGGIWRKMTPSPQYLQSDSEDPTPQCNMELLSRLVLISLISSPKCRRESFPHAGSWK